MTYRIVHMGQAHHHDSHSNRNNLLHYPSIPGLPNTPYRRTSQSCRSLRELSGEVLKEIDFGQGDMVSAIRIENFLEFLCAIYPFIQSKRAHVAQMISIRVMQRRDLQIRHAFVSFAVSHRV